MVALGLAPAILVAGNAVAGLAFPEGAAPGAQGFAVLAIVEFAAIPRGGFHGC